ncbi:branched-chain amino acid ABC transporter permease [Ramlibacter henchirensis]|uniref:Branched-chain amino acid ABC transporter permease n=1 Tax=Ramlibacter henchirensis TaxID=204072 RepID=A0A4Z0BN16_9BURK|nr:branched-chain amino acid ABC transporter permease [Ramlibacter henchirensis]TFZ00693.1 branched-chain amino acid ABC transporter permease [Ramlibacter henchirensis]
MSFPSWTLLAQSVLSGVFAGALYGLLGLGLGLSWGLLRTINLTHFAFAFLSAYICYQLAVVSKVDPLLTLAGIVPLMFALGAALHWLTDRFRLSPFSSLLLTFGFMGIAESVMQTIWTADPRKLESHYAEMKLRLGPLFLPIPELLALFLAVAISVAVWAVLRYTDLGKALRASAEDAPVAAAFGINQRRNGYLLAGTCAALAGVAGVCIALSSSISPSQMYAWVGVVFAAVMLGGLGTALGPLVAGVIIGVSEAVTMAVTSPSWAPLVSFTLLILILLLRPGRIGR